MTPYSGTFTKMLDAAKSLGPAGTALLDALNAWEESVGRAGADGYAAVAAEILHLSMTNHRKVNQIDKVAKALSEALGGKP